MKGVGYSALGIIAWSSYLSQSQARNLTLRPPPVLFLRKILSGHVSAVGCVLKLALLIYLNSLPSQIKSRSGLPILPQELKPVVCRLCPDIPCASVCPTQALDIKSLTKENKLSIKSARMGLATINTQTCLANSL